MKKYFNMTAGILLFLAIAAASCKNDVSKPSETPKEDSLPGNKEPDDKDPVFTKTANWNNRADGAYAAAAANEDLGTVTGWKESRTYISNNTLRIKLEKNALSSAGGIVANVSLDNGTEYEVQFKVKFHSEFDWSKGGKVGFGFRIGDGNTGCDKADDGNGGSARMMWYTSSNGTVRFKPYLYYKDMPDDCGDNMVSSAVYPSSGSIQKGTWYTIKIYVKSNTGSNTNGKVKFSVNDTVILDKAIRWTTNDAKRYINKLSFSTFRGGSSPDWESSTEGYIYFDDLTYSKIN